MGTNEFEVNGVKVYKEDRPKDSRKVINIGRMSITEDYLKSAYDVINNTKHSASIRIIDYDENEILMINKEIIDKIYKEFLNEN